MANQPTAEGVSLLMPYYKNIESAMRQGFNRAETWGVVQEAFQAGGPAFQGATIFDMNYMWGRARDVLNAEQGFAALNPQDAISSQAWTWAPWATPTVAAEQVPSYLLNYTYTVNGPDGRLVLDDQGNPVQVGGVTDWMASIDVTAQDISDRTMGSAQSALDTGSPGAKAQLGDLTGLSVAEVTSIQILRF
jgi:hypothetical protein